MQGCITIKLAVIANFKGVLKKRKIYFFYHLLINFTRPRCLFFVCLFVFNLPLQRLTSSIKAPTLNYGSKALFARTPNFYLSLEKLRDHYISTHANTALLTKIHLATREKIRVTYM